MTYKDLLVVVIRLYGLIALFNTASTLMFYIAANFARPEDDGPIGLFGIYNLNQYPAYFILPQTLSVIIYAILVYKGDAIAGLLHADKGYDAQTIVFERIAVADVVKVGVIILTGQQLLAALPEFLVQSFWIFRSDVSGNRSDYADTFTWALHALIVVVTVLILTKFSAIARFVDRRFDNKREEVTPAAEDGNVG